MDALSAGHRYHLELKARRVAALRAYMEKAFPAGQAVTLEVGCGHGHYLTAYAEAHTAEVCLGVDLVTKRIEKACQKRNKRGLTNLHFLKAEARECLLAWPEDRLVGRIFVLFPDPWPKKRHIKNRILQPALLDALADRARPGTALHFRTDHAATFAWVTEVLEAHPRWRIEACAAWPFESPSYFQDLLGVHRSLTALCE